MPLTCQAPCSRISAMRKRKGKRQLPQGLRGLGKIEVRDTGIFRELVPRDSEALFDFVKWEADRPANFLIDCETHKKTTLAILKEQNFPIKPPADGDPLWLTLPPLISDAYKLILGVDWVRELLSDAQIGRACCLMGKWSLNASEAAKEVRQLAMEERRRLYSQVGERRILEIAGEVLRIGELAQKIIVRPHERAASTGKRVHEGGVKGHKQRYGTVQDKQRRWAAYQKEVNTVAKEFPNLRHSPVCDEVADRLTKAGQKVSSRTIRRHTSLPTVPRK